MTITKEFDKFKNVYLELLKLKGEDISELYLSEDYSVSNGINRNINNLELTFDLFFKAIQDKDELTIQAALLRISTFLSGISGALEQTREDVDIFIQLPNIADFPDDYKIPGHYNYPLN